MSKALLHDDASPDLHFTQLASEAHDVNMVERGRDHCSVCICTKRKHLSHNADAHPSRRYLISRE